MPLRKRGAVWEVSVTVSGQRVRKSAGRRATKEDAYQLEHQLRRQLLDSRAGKTPRISLSAAITRWLDGHNKTLRSAEHNESHVRALLPFIKGKAIRDAPEVAQQVRENMQASPATINRRLALLRRVCKLAHKEWGWLDNEVFIGLLPVHNERHLYMTTAQVETLAKKCAHPGAGDAVLVLAYTGMRKSEFFRVNESGPVKGSIRLDSRTKSGKPRSIPIPARIRPIVKRFPLLVTPQTLRDSFETARVTAKIPEARVHDLRHTYASWLVQAGTSLRTVAELLGVTIAMVQRYAHIEERHLAEAIRKAFPNRSGTIRRSHVPRGTKKAR